MSINEDDARRAVVATSIMLGISGLGSLLYLPILLKSINGVRKVFLILQQICIVGFLLTKLLNHAIMNEANYDYVLNVVGARKNMNISIAEVMIRRLLAALFQSFFLHYQYFLSFMLSWDVYNMIQNPFFYAEFCEKRNILKYLAVGFGLSWLLVMENIIQITAASLVITDYKEFLYDGPQQEEYRQVTNVLDKYRLVKFVITKLLYSAVIIVVAIKTKSALRESSEMTTDKNKERLYKRLFLFTLIPLGINFWNLFSECLDEVWPLPEGIRNDYENRSFYMRKDARTYISASTATIASFAYFVAFPLLFPKVKQSITCGQGEK